MELAGVRGLDDPSLKDAGEVARALGSDGRRGLSHDEARRRQAELGPNRLDAAATVPAWRKLLRTPSRQSLLCRGDHANLVALRPLARPCCPSGDSRPAVS